MAGQLAQQSGRIVVKIRVLEDFELVGSGWVVGRDDVGRENGAADEYGDLGYGWVSENAEFY